MSTTNNCSRLVCLVPSARLELAQLSPLPPQDSVSTNFTTTAAFRCLDCVRYLAVFCFRGRARVYPEFTLIYEWIQAILIAITWKEFVLHQTPARRVPRPLAQVQKPQHLPVRYQSLTQVERLQNRRATMCIQRTLLPKPQWFVTRN